MPHAVAVAPDETARPSVHAAAVSLSAAAIFILELLASKSLLPAFGGTAAVWTSTVAFFQVALVVGYAYAHAASALGARRAALGHAAFVVIAACATSLDFGPAAAALAAPSALTIAALLARKVGLIVVALAGTGPLVQRAYSERARERRGDGLPGAPRDYWIYAASNLGSFAALVAYPFAVEPWFSLSTQRSALFVAFGALAGLLGLIGMRSLSRALNASSVASVASDRPSSRRRLAWGVLAAIPSAVLISATSYLSTAVAAFPLLWSLPLALYLMTLVVAFGHASHRTAEVGAIGLLATAIASLFVYADIARPLVVVVAVHLVALTCVSLACHVALARRRPDPELATEFYFFVALGGAVGGLFCALVAPSFFPGASEYPALLAAGALAAPWSEQRRPIAIDIASIAAIATAFALGLALAHRVAPANGTIEAIVCAGGLGLALSTRRSARTFAASLLAIGAVRSAMPDARGDVVFGARNFFGTVRVTRDRTHRARFLFHGNTIHGVQSDIAALRTEPIGYYARRGPMGPVFDATKQLCERADVPCAIGVVGLGAGGLAAYARPGDIFTFYDVDPLMVRLAEDEHSFTFLADARRRGATIVAKVADGRIALAAAKHAEFALVVLDAFAADSVPVHLITREAVTIYRDRVRSGGLVVFNVTNRYFDLKPVIVAHAEALGETALCSTHRALTADEERDNIFGSTFCAISVGRGAIDELASSGAYSRQPSPPRSAAWTDGYANTLARLK